MNDYIGLRKEDFGTLAICAIRYCQGRMTYMPDTVRKIIIPFLQSMDDRDIGVMLEDCKTQASMQLYGDERIDKPGWLEWEHLLKAEKERRRQWTT